MILVLELIFCILTLLSILDLKGKYFSIFLFILVALILFYVAAFRGENVDRDYGSYVLAFNEENIFASIFEPTFLFFSFIVKTFLSNKVIYIFILYAFFGVIIKLFSIYQISSFPFFSVLLYFSYFFTLQEMTQIRVGAALSFFLMSLPYLFSKNWKFFFALISISFCFHFSTFFLFFLIFINPKKINKTHWLAFLVISIFASFSLKTFLQYVFESFDFWIFQSKILAYGDNNSAELNVFNFWIILRIFIALFLLAKIDLINSHNKYSILLLKIYLLSICFYYIVSFNPIFATRINDILGIVEIVLFPSMIFVFNPKFIGKLILFMYALCFLFLNIFYLKLFN